MRNNNAGCLTGCLAGFSRIMLLMYWISRPVAMEAAFNTFILPCLGFLFLPFTTLMYVWLFPNGIQGLDWVWLILAVFLDLASVAGAAAANRNRIPAGYPGAMTPPPSQPPGATQTPTNPNP